MIGRYIHCAHAADNNAAYKYTLSIYWHALLLCHRHRFIAHYKLKCNYKYLVVSLMWCVFQKLHCKMYYFVSKICDIFNFICKCMPVNNIWLMENECTKTNFIILQVHDKEFNVLKIESVIKSLFISYFWVKLLITESNCR